MDTGSPMGLSFPMSYAHTLSLGEPLRQVGRAQTSFSDMLPIYQARIAGAVRVGPLSFVNPEVRFTAVIPNVNVGMSILRELTLVIDPEAKRSWTLRRQSA
jgi:hypothetical protein